ncbi:MAG: hypothetical protein V1934_00570 [Methanobacteriota archaeon]
MKEFFERLNALGKPKRPDIIEKDFHLHRLLHAVSNDPYLRDNLVFKGGTCLIKAHMSYYRTGEEPCHQREEGACTTGEDTRRNSVRKLNPFQPLKESLTRRDRGQGSHIPSLARGKPDMNIRILSPLAAIDVK